MGSCFFIKKSSEQQTEKSVTPEEYQLAFPYISVAVFRLVLDPPEIHDWLMVIEVYISHKYHVTIHEGPVQILKSKTISLMEIKM